MPDEESALRWRRRGSCFRALGCALVLIIGTLLVYGLVCLPIRVLELIFG